VCYSKYAIHTSNDSKQLFLYTVMNASLKLQNAVWLTFSAKVLTAPISYRSFSFFYPISRFLTYIPIFIFSLLHETRSLILLFTESMPVSISSLFPFHPVYFSSLSSFFLSSYLPLFIFPSIFHLCHCYYFYMSFLISFFLCTVSVTHYSQWNIHQYFLSLWRESNSGACTSTLFWGTWRM
jgi:hypothetical protein